MTEPNLANKASRRLRLEIQGTVQGVGFRPFVYQLATSLGLAGWVHNSAAGVTVEIEGRRSPLNIFLQRLQSELPPHAKIDQLNTFWLEPAGLQSFEIHTSQTGAKTAVVLPDLATCSDCLAEIFDPDNRRYRYPFTNCTHCGPRYSIIETLPYDRPLTTMAEFVMCADCQREYEDPGDRRFHAQPNACPNCGCQIEFWSKNGAVIAQKEDALNETIRAIQTGKIVAIKGLGGFHLVTDAGNFAAVQMLRDRKHRPDKPFAVMYPGLALIESHCEVSAAEKKLLTSAASPIVLLSQKKTMPLASNVAPNNPNLGVMLPYTPLHHLLLAALSCPIVATSGNLSDEPICIDETEALARLGHLVDGFLVHNRKILRPVDDSVVRVMNHTPVMLRRARGYAPEPMKLKQALSKNILAVGSHLKNTVAIAQKDRIFLSQHIGDLSNAMTFAAMQHTLQKLSQIYDFKPDCVVCDRHPDYLSTQYAKSLDIPVVPVQHHHAHVYACLAEHQIQLPVVGIAWDGTGYGTDHTIWGSEFFYVDTQGCHRLAHLKPFPLPGGDKASREPRRSALGLLSQHFAPAELKRQNLATINAFSESELNVVLRLLEKRLNAPMTSSMGRVFDAIASLLDLYQRVSFEAQAAMALEVAIGELHTDAKYDFQLDETERQISIATHGGNRALPMCEIDLEPTLRAIIKDSQAGVDNGAIVAKFHNTLVAVIAEIAKNFQSSGLNPNRQVILTGGCFQNKYLLERSVQKLETENFKVYYPQKFPPNDGAIALGQVFAMAQRKLIN